MERVKSLILELEEYGINPIIIKNLKQKYLGINNQINNQTSLKSFC